MKTAYAILSTILLVGAAAACASAGSASGSSGTKTNQNLITSVEIDAGGFRNAYDVVQRLRPNWFSKAGTAPSQTLGGVSPGGSPATGGSGLVVYLDKTRMGGVAALRDLSASGIGSIEFMDASTAQAKLPGMGSSVITGAIVVRSR